MQPECHFRGSIHHLEEGRIRRGPQHQTHDVLLLPVRHHFGSRDAALVYLNG
jgi:hypothetical protein